jgi:hypothetical protein
MKAEKKKKKSIFLRIALLAFSVYVIVALVSLQVQLNQRRADEAALQNEIERQEHINEDLENKTQNSEEYLEQQARENGMARPGEQIYQEIPGD